MPAGITSQYGFLYQRYVFIKLVLENAGMEKFFVYEGIDDIDISEEQQISSVRESDNTFVQVKSGTVTQECWAKIIGNWLLIEEENPTYKIILENELAFDIRSDEIIKTVYDYFARGATKKTTSIANKIYRKFFQEKKQFDVDLIDIIQKIVDRASCEVISFEIMKSGIEETFKTIYCQDIKVYEMAKVCRCERFVECVNTSIDEAISRKKSFTLKYQDLINFVGKVRDEISDRQFTVDIGEMKKRKKPEAERLLNSDSLREVRQLRVRGVPLAGPLSPLRAPAEDVRGLLRSDCHRPHSRC